MVVTHICVWMWVVATIAELGISASESNCKFQTGDAKGGTEIWVGWLPKDTCIKTCLMRKRTIDDSINGITMYAKKSSGCWCESGMEYRDDSETYKSCYLDAPDPHPKQNCALYYGDGKGGGQIYVGKLRKSECIAECTRRKHEVDDTINGVTVYTNEYYKECYCDKSMTYRTGNKKWQSCFLKVADVHADEKCALFSGDGEGGDEIWIGYLTKRECIAACIKRKSEGDDLINGVTMYASSSKGCWCEKGMKYRNENSQYRNCFLRVPDPNANKRCALYFGDGEGGDNTWVGYLTRSECINTCIKRKATHDDSINGVLVYADENTKGCYCEKGMTYRDTGTKWKSCILRKAAPKNPCKKHNGGCAQVCTNKNGVAHCSCNAGFKVDGKSCAPENPCEKHNGGCAQVCTNKNGVAHCSCNAGFKVDGKSCAIELRCNGQDDDCCTDDQPCGLGEGDCDRDSHCAQDLECGTDNCPWGDNDDCCKLQLIKN